MAVEVTDVVDPHPQCQIIDVTSNQPMNGIGDGNTDLDWVITGALTLSLRAERAGKGGPRVYTIDVECFDEGLNSVQDSVTVTVPHSRRK